MVSDTSNVVTTPLESETANLVRRPSASVSMPTTIPLITSPDCADAVLEKIPRPRITTSNAAMTGASRLLKNFNVIPLLAVHLVFLA